jgi:hypothetical protein
MVESCSIIMEKLSYVRLSRHFGRREHKVLIEAFRGLVLHVACGGMMGFDNAGESMRA